MLRSLLLMITAAWLLGPPPAAWAASLIASADQETPVPVNSELGSIVEFPSAVKTVTPSQHFSIQDIGASESGGKVDVRTFQLRPVPGAQAEAVTFVLANGQALALRLIPTPSGEKFYDVRAERPVKGHGGGKFLGREMAMMRAMILDEAGGFARQVIERDDRASKVNAAFSAGLEFSLRRVYATGGLTGYVFAVENRGSKAVDFEASGFSFARPNRAVLGQADTQRLEPCPVLGTTPGCKTMLRMIVRGPRPSEPMLTTLGASAAPPFAGASSRGEK